MASPLPWWATFACAGLGASIAEIATLPIDTAKVRLQLLKKSGDAAPGSAGAAPRLGMVSVIRLIVQQEGTSALYKGFWPAIQRQLVFASLRVGLYTKITQMFKKPGETTVSLGSKIASGLLSGGIGIMIANPTDLVKVRMQSEGRLAAGQKPRYSGVFNAYATIIRTEGVRGLWTGVGPAILRNSVINATELASYETAKEALIYKFGFSDGLHTHFGAGAAAGLMATIIGNPVDVVKTRVMAARRAAESSVAAEGSAAGAAAAGAAADANAPRIYRGAIDCVVQTLKHEGPMAFYQGVVPQFYRLTGWSIVMFVSFEKLKALAGQQLQMDRKSKDKAAD